MSASSCASRNAATNPPVTPLLPVKTNRLARGGIGIVLGHRDSARQSAGSRKAVAATSVARHRSQMDGAPPNSPSAGPSVLMLIPNLDFGGAQRVFHDHGVLLGRDFEVTEAAFNLDDGCAYPSANHLVSLNVQGGGGSFRKTVNLIRRVRRLRALKRQLGTRVTISHLEGAHYVSLLSGGA